MLPRNVWSSLYRVQHPFGNAVVLSAQNKDTEFQFVRQEILPLAYGNQLAPLLSQ